jgi:histidinol dehydrogenase
MQQYIWNELNETQRADVLRRPALASDAKVRQRVGEIIGRVRREGDAALHALSLEIEGRDSGTLEVAPTEFAAAEKTLTAEQKSAIRSAATNIERFHAAQLPRRLEVETAPGVVCERVSRPIRSVGLYVPAGTAPLPSTALMLGVPARLAGCPTRILCSPAQADGRVDSAVLFAARVAGVERVFRLGGAQAIAAMAYGTESVPKVQKVFGPGNVWVTEAKAQVDGDPDGATRDYPAGPSEVLVIADAGANPEFVAADLLSQAEHGGDSQVLLVTTSRALATAVVAAVAEQTKTLTRRAAIERSLHHSSVILVPDLESAVGVSNRYGPEHLILQVEAPRRWLEAVDAAGSVFLGAWAPESVGDYCSGTNHVLPTYGYAHRYSSLGVGDFLRSMTVQELTREGLAGIGPVAATLARLEGLDAHAAAVVRRLADIRDGGSTAP